MNESAIRSRVSDFIFENYLYMRPDFELGDDQSLLGQGVIDSMGVMELLEFLEDTFAIVVEEDEITEDNLGTLNAIVGFVAAKQRALNGGAPVPGSAGVVAR